MTEPARPTFHVLDRAECDTLLARNSVGRLAFTFRDRVDVEPIHYVYDDGWLYCRTAPGTKLVTLSHHPWVAFEVDEVHGPYDWVSVVVRGTVYFVEDDPANVDEVLRQKVVSRLRTRFPEVFTETDPVPFRTVLFRIHAGEVTGRASSTRSE